MAESGKKKRPWKDEDAVWAISACGGLKKVRRGRRFDDFPLGTILENPSLEWAAMKTGPKTWKVQYKGVPLEGQDVRSYWIEGILSLRSLGGERRVTRHTSVPALDARVSA